MQAKTIKVHIAGQFTIHCTLGQLRGSHGHTAKEVLKVSKLTQIVFWVLFEATMHGISMTMIIMVPNAFLRLSVSIQLI